MAASIPVSSPNSVQRQTSSYSSSASPALSLGFTMLGEIFAYVTEERVSLFAHMQEVERHSVMAASIPVSRQSSVRSSQRHTSSSSVSPSYISGICDRGEGVPFHPHAGGGETLSHGCLHSSE